MSFINTTALASMTIAACVIPAMATLPSAHTWPMEHIMISMDENNNLNAHINTDPQRPIEMRRFLGEDYDGAAGALDDQYYTDQYGWVLNGLVDPGAGNGIWIQLVSQTDGLETYEGGMRMMIGAQSFDPIFGTNGSDLTWRWSGMMTHNWYAATDLGDYSATYSLYVGDSNGDAVDGYGAATVTLNLRTVPTPAPAALLGLGALVATRRRRA